MNKNSGIVQAKEEYTKELIYLLTEPISNKFLEIYDTTLKNSKSKKDIIINNQMALKEIPLWNQAIIDTEVSKIESTCEYLHDLVSAVFVTNVKILSAVKVKKDKKKLQIVMPKCDQFIHKFYISAAKCLYNNAHIYSSMYEPLKRKTDIINYVRTSIEDTIRANLPFANILANYFSDVKDESDSSDSDSDDNNVPSDEEEEKGSDNEKEEEKEEEKVEENEDVEGEEEDVEDCDEGEQIASGPEQMDQSNFLDQEPQPITNKQQQPFGFFDRPTPEQRTIPIQQLPQGFQQMQNPNPQVSAQQRQAAEPGQQRQLFSDAADDPVN